MTFALDGGDDDELDFQSIKFGRYPHANRF